MTKAKIFLRKPLHFKDVCMIYPPSINEVVDNPFDGYYSILTITQEQLDDDLLPLRDENPDLYIPNPLEFLLANAFHAEDFKQNCMKAFDFFIHEPVEFLYDAKSILIGNLEEELSKVEDIKDLRLLTEENFGDFQNFIRISCGRPIYEEPEDLSSLHPKVRYMKMKARERDKIKAKQDAKNAPKLDTLLAAICCMGIGLTPLNVGEISYASINKLMELNQKHEKYEIETRALMWGADPKKMEYWISETKQ